nr:hypothetical protein CFP56_16748 [Quercus suber]
MHVLTGWRRLIQDLDVILQQELQRLSILVGPKANQTFPSAMPDCHHSHGQTSCLCASRWNMSCTRLGLSLKSSQLVCVVVINLRARSSELSINEKKTNVDAVVAKPDMEFGDVVQGLDPAKERQLLLKLDTMLVPIIMVHRDPMSSHKIAPTLTSVRSSSI